MTSTVRHDLSSFLFSKIFSKIKQRFFSKRITKQKFVHAFSKFKHPTAINCERRQPVEPAQKIQRCVLVLVLHKIYVWVRSYYVCRSYIFILNNFYIHYSYFLLHNYKHSYLFNWKELTSYILIYVQYYHEQ